MADFTSMRAYGPTNVASIMSLTNARETSQRSASSTRESFDVGYAAPASGSLSKISAQIDPVDHVRKMAF
jgi:hypothetical protein